MNFALIKSVFATMASLAAVVLIVAWVANKPADNFKCPNDYANADEYIRGIAEWASGELEKSPNLTKDDLLVARENLFKAYNCEKSKWPSLGFRL